MLKDLIENLKLSVNVARYDELDSSWDTSSFNRSDRIIPFGQLYLPIEGEGCIVYYGQKYHLRPGYIYLIPPYAPVEASCPKRLIKYWLNFNAYILDSDLDIFNIIEVPIELPVIENDREYFTRLFHELAIRHYAPGKNKNIIDKFTECGILTVLLTPFLNAVKIKSSKAEFENSKRISDILSYIEKNLDQSLTLKQLGKEFCLSPTYLTNFFASIMGVPLMTYCYKRRIKRAIDLLCYTDLSINEIIVRVGFSDASNFSKKFKQQVGVSPLAFRRSYKS
jgi:AraC-like DNA-binding protein